VTHFVAIALQRRVHVHDCIHHTHTHTDPHTLAHTHTHTQIQTDTHTYTRTFARLVAQREGLTHNINKPSHDCVLPVSGVAQLFVDGPNWGRPNCVGRAQSWGGHTVVVEAPPHAVSTQQLPCGPPSTHTTCVGGGGQSTHKDYLGVAQSMRNNHWERCGSPPAVVVARGLSTPPP
jgi:hypothetical protein